MAQILQIRNKGLYTSPNEFSSVPAGAQLRADNCVINVDNIIEPRRGQDRVATVPDANAKILRLDAYQSTVVATWGASSVGYRSGSTFVAYSGTFADPDTSLARRRFLLAASNLYFTSSTGIWKLDSVAGTPTLAGSFKGLDIQTSLSGASGFLSNNNQAAYRVVFGIRDAQSNLILGAPSGRAIIVNASGGTRDVQLVITLPSGITTAHFVQIYRSKMSGGVAVTPDDELGLVYENNPTAGEISSGTMTVTDRTPDDLRGATIYTAVSQQGIAQANERPPLANDFEEFNECVLYADVSSKQRKTFTILAVGGTGGIQLNDTLTIAGTTYTAKATETIASREYQLVTGGTPAQNIADTAASLVRVINRNTTNTSVYAYYLSGPNDLPGQILIEERGLGSSSFAITASANGTAFNPTLPTSGTSVSSTNDDFSNGLMASKVRQPEAVPLVNIFRVGSANNRILRLKKLRNSVFIFKEREGIYRLTGTSPENFQIELFDSSAKLLAPDSIAVVNNQIWCLCDQGITVVTETGVSVVSRPIEDLILDQFGLALDAVRYYSFGVGYETERSYQLWTVSSAGDTVATQCFQFNVFTQAFTRLPLSRSAGFVSPVNDRLYLGDGVSANLLEERKNRDYSDYVDWGVGYTITSSSSRRVLLTSTNEIEVGDILYQSSTVNSPVTDVQPGYVDVEDVVSWSAGAATVYKAYECDIEYAALDADNPGTAKQFPECSWLFKSSRFATASVGYSTDISPAFEYQPITGNRSGLWGLFPWGLTAWGGGQYLQPKRTFVPLEKQRGSYIRARFLHRQGYGYFQLLGLSLPVRDTGSFVVAK